MNISLTFLPLPHENERPTKIKLTIIDKGKSFMFTVYDLATGNFDMYGEYCFSATELNKMKKLMAKVDLASRHKERLVNTAAYKNLRSYVYELYHYGKFN